MTHAWRLALSATVLLGLAVLGGAPASAAGSAPNVFVDGPPSPQTSPSSTITGHADQPKGHLTHVHAELKSDRGQPVPGAFDSNVNSPTYQLSWPVNLPYNGTYTATFKATGFDESLVGGGATPEGRADRAFDVNVAPAVPTGVTANLNDARSVSLSWDRNGEPDMVFYQVQRIRGDETPVALNGVAQTAAGQRPSYFDDLAGAPGGTYRYRVVAVRQSAKQNQGITSGPSSSANVTVADPPSTTAGPGGSGGGGGGSGGGGGANGGKGGGLSIGSTPGSGKPISKSTTVDFSSFGAQLNGTKNNAGEPDGTFDPNLPFKDRTQVITKTVPGSSSDPVAGGESKPVSLLTFAAGLLVTAVLMHVLWLKREIDRVPLDALEVEAPVET